MLRIVRACSLIAFLLAAAFARAQTAAAAAATPPAPAPAALDAELQAELDALPDGVWQPTAIARASVGWRDNILLSPFAPIARAFGRGEIEAMLLRPMRDRWEFVSFLNGDVLRFLSPPPEIGGEQQWSLHAEGRWQPVERARVALKATGYLRDTVLDLSETEAERVVAPTRVRGGYVGTAVRLLLPAGFRLEPSAQLKRSDYQTYPGDYDEVRAGGRLEWRRGDALALSAAWFDVCRDYDHRVQFTAGGRALTGTRLEFRQREGELKARVAWTAAGEWSVAATASQLENRDGASGYFDYDQRRARLEAEWRRGAWRVALDADARRMDYLVQTVGAGLAPPPRIADDSELLLRGERELYARWSVFAEHRWERSRSNEAEFSYRANTVLAGVQCRF